MGRWLCSANLTDPLCVRTLVGEQSDFTPESMHATDAAYLGKSADGDGPVMKARTGVTARGVDGESSPQGLHMNHRIDQVGGWNQQGVTLVRPNLMCK